MADLLITLTQHEENPNNVTIAFTMGNEALNKGHSVDIVLLSDAVALAQKDYAQKINIGEPFKPLPDLLAQFFEDGGHLKVCKACMIHNGVKEEDLIPHSIIITAPDVIDLLMDSKKSLQLN